MIPTKQSDHFLDITEEVCPFTYIRTKLLLERLISGEIMEIRLNAGELLNNIQKAAKEFGGQILLLNPEDNSLPQGIHRLFIQKS